MFSRSKKQQTAGRASSDTASASPDLESSANSVATNPDSIAPSVPTPVLPASAAGTTTATAIDDDPSVVHLVTTIVGRALRERSSDVHIEPLNDVLRIRFRIDGTLIEAQKLPLAVHASVVSRLKIMAGMNIVERRRPQDG